MKENDQEWFQRRKKRITDNPSFLRDRNDFSQFLLELDPFIDDPNALVSIDSFIDEIEKDFGIDKPKKTRRARNKKTE